jgi:hypothetical protein
MIFESKMERPSEGRRELRSDFAKRRYSEEQYGINSTVPTLAIYLE